MPVHYNTLFVALVFETAGTTALRASQQFKRLVPSVIVAVAYGLSFYLLALTLRHMPVGIVCIAAIGFAVLGQHLDLPAILGLGLILSGVLVIHLFSSSAKY